MTFQELGLNAPIVRALEAQGYEKPSPIQERAIPSALSGRDVLGLAQTGTGKTCAFGAPILQRLDERHAQGRPIRALILTPTRELAIQIGDSFAAYGRYLSLRHTVIFGGVGQAPQVSALRAGVDILVATPGRLIDLYQQKLVDFSHLEIFVLDEADRMLDMGFIHDVKKILAWLPKKKQTMLFSATMPTEISQLVDALLHDPVRVEVDPVSSPVARINQSVCFVDRSNKTKLLAHLVKESKAKNALVFTRTKHGANKVAGDLQKLGISAAAIHGNKSQTARQQALSDFKAGRVRVLVATDIAARGIDIEELSHVFNYNLPEVPETYVHRIGRTGRAGHGGAAIAFCDFSEKPLLKEVEKLLGKPIPVMDGHPFPMENFQAAVKDAKGRIVNQDDAEARQAARQRKKTRNAAPKQQKAPAPAPAPKPAKQEQPKRGARQHRLADTIPAAPAVPEGDFYRPDPLASDHIMDATARLLAPRPRTVVPAAKKPQGERPDRSGKSNERTAASHSGGRKKSRRKSAPSGEAAAQEKPVITLPTESQKPKKQTRPTGDVRKQPKGKESRTRSGAPRRPEPINRSHIKDSTEQKSLMKPYYLNQD